MRVILVGLAMIAGCSSSAPEAQPKPDGRPAPSAAAAQSLSRCEEEFRAAAAVDDMRDTVSDLDGALRACGSLAEWGAAHARFPGAIDSRVDPELWLVNRCSSAAVKGSRMCLATAPTPPALSDKGVIRAHDAGETTVLVTNTPDSWHPDNAVATVPNGTKVKVLEVKSTRITPEYQLDRVRVSGKAKGRAFEGWIMSTDISR